MAGRVENKIAVVTGGTSGIGLATAKLLAAEGAKVFVTGRRGPELASALEQIGHDAVGVQGDVSKLEDLDRLFTAVREQEGRLDILFANAGTAEHLTIGQVSESQFEAGFSANVKGVFFCMQKALPLMPDGAAVVLNASMWTIKGIPGFGVLSASKAAVRSFARTWANELRARRIRVNVVVQVQSILRRLRRRHVAGKTPSDYCRNWLRTYPWAAPEGRTRLQKRSYFSLQTMQAT